MAKNILVVSQYFYPENFRINDICQEWVKRGYKVSVVTGIPNYPMGKCYKGYGLLKKRHEVWNGIEIYRIPLIPRGKSSIGMIANYLSFMISGMIAGKVKKITADLVFSFEVSPMTQVLTGISFARKLKIPHFLYVQDLWPENVITVTGISSPIVVNPIQRMVDFIYKNVDEIYVTSPSFVESICNRKIPVPKEKVHYWPQYAEDFYSPMDKNRAKLEAEPYGIPNDGSFKIIFTGNIGTAQGLQILPKTAELLQKMNIKFVIVGDGRYLDDFNKDIQARNLQNMFIMIPRQSAEIIPMLLCACDAAFISFADQELWKKTIPAKLQSYMACGMPIIASAQGETERVISEAGCGICSHIGDEFCLADAIKKIMKSELEKLGLKSRHYYEITFDRQQLMNEMDDIFADY